MTLTLGTKTKLGFINGSITVPDENSDSYGTWEKVDSMVRTWILNSISKDIANGFLFTNSAFELQEELKDRFGELPQTVTNLLYIAEIKQLAAKAMVESISTKDKLIILHFSKSKKVGKLHPAQMYEKDGVKIGTKQITIDIEQLGSKWLETLNEILYLAD